MGCFSACFGRCSDGYKKIGRHHEVLHQKIEPTREAQIADHLKIVDESVDNNEDQLNRSARKSAEFDDLNLTNQEEEAGGSQTLECANQVTGEEEKGRVIVLPEVLYSEEKAVGEQGVKNQQKFQKENPDEKEEKIGHGEKMLGKGISEESGRDEIPISDSSESSLFTYPTNNRYKNCAEISDDEDEDEVVVSSYKVKERDADGGSSKIPEDSSESSLFSLSIDSRRRQSFTPGGGTVGDDKEEVSSKTFITTIPSDDNDNDTDKDKDKDKHIDSVLKPIENLSQWKKIVRRKAKSSSTMGKNQEQENVDLEEFTLPFQPKKKTSNSCRVDTSLSSWLVDSENSPQGSVGNSSSSLKKTKSSSSLRRSRSHSFSPDETNFWYCGKLLEAHRWCLSSGHEYSRFSLKHVFAQSDQPFSDQVRGSNGQCQMMEFIVISFP